MHFGLPFKRGILLYGPPGSGKTCTIRFVMSDVIKLGGVVINFSIAQLFKLGFDILRQIQPETPTIVIMEDLDSLLIQNNESELLNLLDGLGSIENTVFLATTNYPERLGARISNRPSRFDKRFKIGFPNEECRKIYLETLFSKLTDDQRAEFPPLQQWVTDTPEMSLAHLKELFSNAVILGNPYSEAIEVIKEMNQPQFGDDDLDYPGIGGFAAKHMPLNRLIRVKRNPGLRQIAPGHSHPGYGHLSSYPGDPDGYPDIDEELLGTPGDFE